MFDRAKKFVGEKTVSKISEFLVKDPEKNIEKGLNLAAKLAIQQNHKYIIENIREHILDPNSNWHKLYVKAIRETSPEIIERLAINFFVNSVLNGIPKQYELAEKLGYSIPWAILFDPTDRCNLRCKGCWAGEYTQKNDLEFELLDRIVSEGEDLNIFFYVVSGGEPTVRKDDIVKLALGHPDSIFHLFTNGTLIDDKFAEQCVKAGNITFAISIEGFEESTDARRGKGVFQKVMKAAEILKRHGLVYGFSTAYHRYNVEEVSSDEYIDMLVDNGFKFGWYFTYVPVGSDSDLEFMATPEQREYIYHRVHKLRETKPIFIADFWNDGATTEGCIAGGRRYCHINASGDVEPCAFIHYATCNIRDVSLKEALGNQLFRAYQKRQPFNDNMLRPCPLIDNPDQLAACVNECGAYSTQIKRGDVNQLAQALQGYANDWGTRADILWEEQRNNLK